MKNRTKLNLFFQITYQIINACIPIFTAPYLARALGVEQLGVFSYTSSIVSYFTLFSMLGTITYGTKVISSCADDIDERNRKFSEIYAFQLMTSLLCILSYAILCLFMVNDRLILYIQIISVLSCFFDVTWLFFGLEKFKLTIGLNFVTRVMSVACIFIFVHNSNDLWIYTLIMVGSVLLSQMLIFLQLRRNVKFVRVKFKDIFGHLKNNLILFIPLLAMSIYHSMDKTMLGILSDNVQSGLYYNADKVINIPLGVIAGIGTVMLPRLTAMYTQGEDLKARQLFVCSIELVSLLCIGMAFGIAAISDDFIPIFFGDGYMECILLVCILSPVILLKGISDTVRTQYLIPLNKEKVFIISVITGAVFNLLLNVFLIRLYGALGAIIATLIAEFVSFLVQVIYIGKKINLLPTLLHIIVYAAFGVGMYFAVKGIATIECNGYLRLGLEIGIGALLYLIVSLAYTCIFNKKLLFLFKRKEKPAETESIA